MQEHTIEQKRRKTKEKQNKNNQTKNKKTTNKSLTNNKSLCSRIYNKNHHIYNNILQVLLLLHILPVFYSSLISMSISLNNNNNK